VAYEKWDSENAWESGRAAFFRSWVSDYSLIHSHTPPTNATQFGITSVPGGTSGRASALGGNGLAISRDSAHPREALELIRFLRQRDAEMIRTSENSEPPKEQELYEMPVVIQLYPQLPQLREHGGAVVARPSIPAGQKYEEVTRAYIRTLEEFRMVAAISWHAPSECRVVNVFPNPSLSCLDFRCTVGTDVGAAGDHCSPTARQSDAIQCAVL
jgi:trehalose/maltose transport system substrate-binding protein